MSNLDELSAAVAVLKKNREAVSLKDLKTRYASSYKALLEKIKKLSSQYYREYIFDGILVTNKYLSEYMQYIKASIYNTELPAAMSSALYKEYNVKKFSSLVEEVRGIILEETQKFYLMHTMIYISEGGSLFISPEQCQAYCPVNNCFLVDKKWVKVTNTISQK